MSSPRPRDIVIVALLVSGLLASLVLVIFGGASGSNTTTTAPVATLPIERVSVDELESWSGLVVPDDAADFLTARMGSAQLDVTFTIRTDGEADFVESSDLSELEVGRRVVLHSSPLWKLNPGDPDEDEDDGDTMAPTSAATPPPEIRGTVDVRDGITRVVEVYEESPGTLRVRAVLTPAG